MLLNAPLTAVPARDVAPEWVDAEARLLAAVEPGLRARVEALLPDRRLGGRGLRSWIGALAADGRPLPECIPAALIEVYLRDGEAVPLHDCESCGLAVPVRPSRLGHEADPERVYFAACPHCGGRTGLYAYWAHPPTTAKVH